MKRILTATVMVVLVAFFGGFATSKADAVSAQQSVKGIVDGVYWDLDTFWGSPQRKPGVGYYNHITNGSARPLPDDLRPHARLRRHAGVLLQRRGHPLRLDAAVRQPAERSVTAPSRSGSLTSTRIMPSGVKGINLPRPRTTSSWRTASPACTSGGASTRAASSPTTTTSRRARRSRASDRARHTARAHSGCEPSTSASRTSAGGVATTAGRTSARRHSSDRTSEARQAAGPRCVRRRGHAQRSLGSRRRSSGRLVARAATHRIVVASKTASGGLATKETR